MTDDAMMALARSMALHTGSDIVKIALDEAGGNRALARDLVRRELFARLPEKTKDPAVAAVIHEELERVLNTLLGPEPAAN